MLLPPHAQILSESFTWIHRIQPTLSMEKSFIIIIFVCLMCSIDSQSEQGIGITKNPDPQSVCAGNLASFTWRYDAMGKAFQSIYWSHRPDAGSKTSVMCEYLLRQSNPSCTLGPEFKGRLIEIAKPPEAVDGGNVTLVMTETRQNDSGTIFMSIATTSGAETKGTGNLMIMEAPSLIAGQSMLGLEWRPHNMTTALIHCTNIQNPGTPPAMVAITMSVPGRNQVFKVPVENGEGKQAFFGTERFGTFTCGLVGPATACRQPPFQSSAKEIFTTPGTPLLTKVEPKGDSVKLTFVAGFHGGTSVNFIAKYQEMGTSDWMKAGNTLDHLDERKEGSLEIQGLQPLTNYSVYVMANNSQGSKQSKTESFSTRERNDGLSPGSIVGIVIGVLAGVCIVGAVVWWKVKKRQGGEKKGTPEEMENMSKPPVAV